MEYTTHTTKNKSKRCNGKTKAFTTYKAILYFIDISIVHRLSASLSIAKGKENTCTSQEARNNACSNYCNNNTNYTLKKICSNGCNTRIYDFTHSLFSYL